MKPKLVKLLSLPLLLGVFSLSAVAGHLEDELETVFDDVVLNGKLSNDNLSELSKTGITQVSVTLKDSLELVTLSATKLSGVHLTAFKNTFQKHQSPEPVLDASLGEFQVTYAYKNLLAGTAVYRLTFASETLKRFAIDSLDDDAEYFSLEDSDSDDVDSAPAESSVRIKLLSSTLTELAVLFNKAMIIGGEADHLWALLANGTRGFINLYDGFTRFSLCSAAIGTADIASAVVGTMRLCTALNGASDNTHELFSELDTKLDLISDISAEMANVLSRVQFGLSQVNATLEKNISVQEKLLTEWTSAHSESDERVQKALALLRQAQSDHSNARERLHEIALACEKIELGWASIKKQLESLGDAAEVDGDRSLVIQTIQLQIKAIQEQIILLEEPMQLAHDFIIEITALNSSIGVHFTDAIKNLVETLEQQAKAEECCRLLSKENDKLKECLRVNTVNERQIGEVHGHNRQLQQTTAEAGIDVVLLKAAVDKKYDLRHLIVGASAAVFVASVMSCGVLPVAGIGLATAHAAKTIDHSLLIGDAHDDQFHTSVGALAHRLGVSTSFIQNIGQRLGYTYQK